jgi:hypothetical protein
MRSRLIWSIVGVQSVVALHLYNGRGLDLLQVVFQANPAVLANISREKLETLTDFANKRTVRTSRLDRPRGRFCAQHMSSCLLVEFDEPKSYELSLMQITGFFNPIWWSFNRAPMHKGRLRLHLSRSRPFDQWIKGNRMEVPPTWIDKGSAHIPWVHHRTIPYLNGTIYQRWVGRWKASWHHRMNRRCLLCRLSSHFVRPFCFSRWQGFHCWPFT